MVAFMIEQAHLTDWQAEAVETVAHSVVGRQPAVGNELQYQHHLITTIMMDNFYSIAPHEASTSFPPLTRCLALSGLPYLGEQEREPLPRARGCLGLRLEQRGV